MFLTASLPLRADQVTWLCARENQFFKLCNLGRIMPYLTVDRLPVNT